MNETTKTLALWVLAAASVGAAWVGRPRSIGTEPPAQIGAALFEGFDDPYLAKSMEVVEFDGELGKLTTFRVAQKNGQWVIPSHQDYPADAEDSLKDAASSLVGMEIINVVSRDKKDHTTYGVVKPTEDTSLGDEGVGKLITMKDDTGRTLAEVVIGKAVQGQEGQHYVRAGDIDLVYTVKVDPSKISTKFADWIQADVLDLNGFDISQMTIRDYSSRPELGRGGIMLDEQQRLEVAVGWNAEGFNWKLDRLLELQGNALQPSMLLEGEELNKQALDGMKNALDDLKIVDVERKPQGLGADLKTEESFWDNEEGIRSLFEHGFYPVRDKDGMKLRCSDGEVEIQTKEGVEYLLRFGEVAGLEQGSAEGNLNRFVMITATVNEATFEKPVLELPEGMEPTADPASDSSNAEETATPTDTESTATDKTAAEKTAAASTAAETADSEPTETADATSEASQAVSEADAERDRLIKEYERKKSEYDDKIAKARDKVQNLNLRFADWYYVVSEGEYKKIHLRRSDIVTQSEQSADEGFGLDALRSLEDEGLKRDE